MELLVAFVAGAILALLATKRTLTIKVQHEEIYPQDTTDPYDEPDEKEDTFYSDIDRAMQDISSVMGGGRSNE